VKDERSNVWAKGGEQSNHTGEKWMKTLQGGFRAGFVFLQTLFVRIGLIYGHKR